MTRIEAALEVHGVPGRMCQVFVNLLVNAAQAAAETDRHVTIEVDVFARDEDVVARVHDDGPGIPESTLPRAVPLRNSRGSNAA